MTTLSSICYHYLSRTDEFKRIWGHEFSLYKSHINFLKGRYDVIEPKNLLSNVFEEGKNYMLLTFDDGLKEHVAMAEYLDNLGLKGVFSVPSCILRGEPANPQILHFSMAFYGVRKFYKFVEMEIRQNFPHLSDKLLSESDTLEIFDLHGKVKNIFKWELDPEESRQILMNIYTVQIKKIFPDFVERIFLSKNDIMHLVNNGHTLAVHSDTHPSIKNIKKKQELLENEIVQAKKDLSQFVGSEIEIFTHPFGSVHDILKNTEIFTDSGYKIILTTYQDRNVYDPLHLGRYCTFRNDTTQDLTKNLWSYNVS